MNKKLIINVQKVHKRHMSSGAPGDVVCRVKQCQDRRERRLVRGFAYAPALSTTHFERSQPAELGAGATAVVSNVCITTYTWQRDRRQTARVALSLFRNPVRRAADKIAEARRGISAESA